MQPLLSPNITIGTVVKIKRKKRFHNGVCNSNQKHDKIIGKSDSHSLFNLQTSSTNAINQFGST